MLGDGLKYEAMAVTPEDSQIVEQMKLAAEQVCTAFGVPAYKVGVGPPPAYNNIGALEQAYYSQCLQHKIESIEVLLDDGLGLVETGRDLRTEFDLDDLLRMDTATFVDTLTKQIGSGIMAPNEARARLDMPPVQGGASPVPAAAELQPCGARRARPEQAVRGAAATATRAAA